MPYVPTHVSPFSNELYWNHLEPLDGQIIYCGTEDSNGVLWFATKSGLLKYDGFEVEKIPYSEAFENSRPIALHVESNSLIYIRTDTKLFCYKDQQWVLMDSFPLNLKNRNVFQSSVNGDLYTFSSNQISQIRNDKLIALIESPERILDILTGGDECWVKTKSGLTCYTIQGHELVNPVQFALTTFPEPNQSPARLIAGEQNNIYIVLDNSRFFKVDRNSKTIETIGILGPVDEYDIENLLYSNRNDLGFVFLGKSGPVWKKVDRWTLVDIPKTIPVSSPFFIKRDNGNLIIGGYGEPVYEIDFSFERWTHMDGLHFQCEDENGSQWFLSRKGEIIESVPNIDKWFNHTGDIIDTPTAINVSKDGAIWVSGANQGKAALSVYHHQIWEMFQFEEEYDYIAPRLFLQWEGQVIFSLRKRGRSHPDNLVAFEKQKNEYIPSTCSITGSPESIALGVGSENGFWVSSDQIHSLDNGRFNTVEIPDVEHEWIDALDADSDNNIWVGIWQEGVFRWNGKTWDGFTNTAHIPSNNVLDLKIDKELQKLWVGTRAGISSCDLDSDQWIPDVITNGLNLTREGVTLKTDSSGALWINETIRGWFIRRNANSQHTQNEKTLFRTSRYSSDSAAPVVKLLPYQNNITEEGNLYFSWQGTDYFSRTPQKDLYYSFKLDENQWSQYTKETSLILSNLEPGDYSLSIRCRDLDGNVSTRNVVGHFVVEPIIYKQTWFIVSVILILFLVVILIILLVRQRIVNLIQMEEFKLQFFTNISHELRTPLTVILSPLDNYLKHKGLNDDTKPLELALRSARKMLRLVDQLLEFRKIEIGKEEHRYVHADIILGIKNTVHLLEPLADEKQQQLTFTFSKAEHVIWFESEKLEKIVDNLVLNAIKYTPQNGDISIRVSFIEKGEREHLELLVEDSGVGIPENRITHIFDPYTRLKNSEQARGTGLGLTFTKSLVDSLDGAISVSSPVTKFNDKACGTRFIVHIPVFPTHPRGDLISDPGTNAKYPEADNPIDRKQSKDSASRQQLLLVEDDEDIMEYLSLELAKEFEVLPAVNGSEGLVLAKKRVPDIIVTDVMMPGMDGRDFCGNIKKTEETAHIPVIMLTALSETDSELKGLERGADDYLIKPVDISILKQRIKNQLEIRSLLHQKYSRLKKKTFDAYEMKSVVKNTTDEEFMKKYYNIIESSIEDPLFDVEKLAANLFMSRNTLYRKIKAITGDSPGKQIRSVRIDKAKHYLAETTLSISEISDKTGFQDVSYFSTSFKGIMKCTPKEFRKSPRGPV